MTGNKNIDDPVIRSVTSRAIIPGYKFGSPFNSNDNAKMEVSGQRDTHTNV